MTDELTTLRQANPITPESLERAVALDRKTLIEMLDADAASAPHRLSAYRDRPSRSATRVGYVGAMAVAAALIVVALVGAQEPADQDLVDPAGDGDVPASVAVDELDGDAASTDDQPADVVVQVDDGSAVQPESEAAPASEPTPAPNQESGSAPDQRPSAQPEPATSPTVSEAAAVFTAAPLPDAAPFDPSTDVLSIHLDYFHRDDGHAAVAARELATWFGLAPHVVGGTAANEFDGSVHPFATLMDITWGDAWFDARTNRERSLQATVERWLEAIDGGGVVWVAEGGASDFTAEVLVELQTARPDLDTRTAVQVVQHSARNEEGTAPENLEFVTTNTSYQRIDDGNQTNTSANLDQRSEAFQAAALTGRHSEGWAAAFDYLPADRLDFSDTVEVLHILGVSLDVVSGPDEFAAQFMG